MKRPEGRVEAKAGWSRQRPGGVEAKAGPTAISCRQSLYEISGCVCSMPCTWRPVRTCILPSSPSIARLRGRPPFRPFPPQKRAGRRCRCLKACCGIKLGLGWFRHTKGMLLYFKSNTLRVRLRGRHTQRPALKPCISACVSVQQQRLFNLDASEKLV